MARPASQMRMPPPIADTSVIGPECSPFDPVASASLHYLEHGSNSRLVRWHHHACYELHLLVATRGLAYVGDSVSRFAPWSLVLVGPHLPHNWVSDSELAPAPLRDRVLQFSEAFLLGCEQVLPHPCGIQALREEAPFGIEFPSRLGRELNACFARIGQTQGLARLSIFFELLAALCDEPERRRLSQRAFGATGPGMGTRQIEQVIEYIRQHYARDITLGQLAAEFLMSDSAFSHVPAAQRLRLCRLPQPDPGPPGLRSAGRQQAGDHRDLLRGRLQQPVQFQSPLPGLDRRHST